MMDVMRQWTKEHSHGPCAQHGMSRTPVGGARERGQPNMHSTSACYQCIL